MLHYSVTKGSHAPILAFLSPGFLGVRHSFYTDWSNRNTESEIGYS